MRGQRFRVGAATDELTGLDLGDARRNRRTRRVVAALAREPAAGFPAVMGSEAEREAVYRLLRNEAVTLEGLLAPHVAQTVQRARTAASRPLVVIDKTAFVFAGEAEREGLTRLGAARHGFDAMVALAVAPRQVPLGVLAIQPLAGNAGKRGAAGWAATVAAADRAVGTLQPIYVMDREADAYALFAELIAHGRDFVIRVATDRWVQAQADAAPEWLRPVVARAPIRLHRTVRLARRSGIGTPRDTRRRHPPREGREAVLTIQACPVVLPRPPKLPDTLPASLTVQVVLVTEPNPPADAAPVEWVLVTTLPVANEAACSAVVDHYRARWTIEEYFKALKSGCAYEQRQLESRATLLTALGLLAPLAWRLLALRTLAQDDTTPADTLLDADELHVLRHLARDRPLGPAPTAAQAMTALAGVGGHFRHNGRPGWQVLWTGWQKLLARVEGYRLARAELAAASSTASTDGCEM